MRCLLYARVSTLDKGQNPQVQINELRQFCTLRGWKISEEVSDNGYSGGTDQRPGLKRLLCLARSREIDIVVCTKLDRMARSLKHLVSLLDEFNSLGVIFVSVRDQIDLSTASGRLMVHIIGAFSEFERSLIRERTMAGLAFAKSKGKQLGRPKCRNDEAILKLRQLGMTYSQIQKELNTSRPAIGRAIREAGTKTPKNLPKKSQSNQGGSDE
jgi:DNA invertase Pin-like site-specific DNA recombinase